LNAYPHLASKLQKE